MAGYTPLPPTILHSTNPITHAEAHSLLSAFLERAYNDAAYRPDSTLTEHGPQSTSTATKSDLTLHHLNRIKLGLEGKALGVEDLENGFLDSLGGTARKRKRDVDADGSGTPLSGLPATPASNRQLKPLSKYSREVFANADEKSISSGPGVAAQLSDNDWQDKEDYELAQGNEEEVDMHNAQQDPGAGLQQPADAEEEQEPVDMEVEGTGERVDPRVDTGSYGSEGNVQTLTKARLIEEARPESISKEERKRRKRERKQDEKRTREAEKIKKG